jgi:hypothetical protein
MSGYVFATGQCVACRRLFSFNPHHVPSVRVNGVREPVCRDCIEQANKQRAEMNLPPFEILPDAYEPMPEEEF